jgi:hypothetical protein
MIAHAKTRLAKLEAKASPPMQVREIELDSQEAYGEAFVDAYLRAASPTLLKFAIAGKPFDEVVVGVLTHEELLEELERHQQCK